MKKIHAALEVFMCLRINCGRAGKTTLMRIIPIYNPQPLIADAIANRLSHTFIDAFIQAARRI